LRLLVQDNLGVRLLLLERRLAERDFGLHLERTGRGSHRLVASGPLEMHQADGAQPGCFSAPWKGAVFQWVRIRTGNCRFSRKQAEQSERSCRR
jgi:hypothetical protein